MCVSVVQSLHDERKILMKMSSNEAPSPAPERQGFRTLPLSARVWPWTSAPSTDKPLSRDVPLAQTLALNLALTPLLGLGRSSQHQEKQDLEEADIQKLTPYRHRP